MAAQNRTDLNNLLTTLITTNNNKENTADRLRQVIAALIESLQNLIDDGAMIITNAKPADSVGVDGMAAFDRINFIIYNKAGGSWDAGASIVGSPGAPGQDGVDGADGEPGPVGAPGADGISVLITSGQPSGGTGVDGQTAIDPAAGLIYTKSGGSWDAGVSIVGPQGDPGPAGSANLPRYATEGDLPASNAGDVAIVEDGPQLAIDDGNGGWILQLFDAYNLTAATKTLLETPANFTKNVYSGSAIAAENLVPGQRHIDSSNANIEYFCIGATGSAYWVKLDYSASAGGDANNLGYFPTLSALISAHPSPAVGQYAFIGEDSLPRTCSTAGTWNSPAFDQYDVAEATITLLENEANWWGAAGPNMYDPAATAIAAADLVVGKRYSKADEPVHFECIDQNGSPVWIRTGNRIPISIEIDILAQGVTATAGAKRVGYLAPGDLILTHLEASVGNVAHAGGSLDFSLEDDGVSIASVSIPDGSVVNSDTTGLPVTIVQGSKIDAIINAVPATAGEGHSLFLSGFMAYKKAGQSGGGGSSSSFTEYNDTYRRFDQQGDFTTETIEEPVGTFTDMFVSAPNQVVAHQGSAGGDEFYSNDTSQHAGLVAGWQVVPEGIQLIGSEISIKARMFDGTDEDGLSLDNGQDYLFHYLELYQGGMSENRKKGQIAHKKQTNNPHNLKVEDNFNTATDGTGTAESSVNLPYASNPTNGTKYFTAVFRDSQNQRIVIWHGEVAAGLTKADLFENDTISQSTADGQVLYLDTTGGLRTENNTEQEFFFQEGSTWIAGGFKKYAPTGDYAAVKAQVEAFYESYISEES